MADDVSDVGPVEPGDDQAFRGNPELGQDIGTGCGIGSCGQRQTRHIGVRVHQRAQQAVIGAEIVAPFGNAVRLVDREQADRGLG